MQFLTTVRLILSLLPLILDTIRIIEQSLPQGGAGREKLALVRTAIESAWDAAAEKVGDINTLWPAIERVIGAAVAMYNNAGAFKKSA